VRRVMSAVLGWPRGRGLGRRAAVTLAAYAGIAGVAFVAMLVGTLPDGTALLGVAAMDQATVAFDRYDRPAFTLFREQRIEVPLDRISPHVVSAIVAVEDRRFYDHHGVDPIRIVGAALHDLRQRGAEQGASTLTQQLAKQAFLTRDKTVRRKLREAILAIRLERLFTKNQILEMYLNKVYFGDGLHGIEAAALGFFGKHADELDVAEGALLAGLVKAPSTYAPTVDLDRATERRNLVLQVMLDSGAIDGSTYAEAVAMDVVLSNGLLPAADAGRYFREEVRRELVQRFGAERVYQGGLRVYTTLDPDMQRAAEREVARALAMIERRQRKRRSGEEDDPLQAALVALDPAMGQIRAMVGGRDFSSSEFNRATQARRQPGSAFKPFVYAAALEQGYSAATMIDGLARPVSAASGEWVPEDAHVEDDSMSMRSALRLSSNRAAVRMLETVGISNVLDSAERLGIGSQPRVPSVALGSGDVTLLSMTRAFAAFANGGVMTTPTILRRVEAIDGQLLYEATPDASRAVTATTAFIVTSMLADVIDFGTGRQARQAGFTKPAAGKTGTTNDYRDAWFVGYTPHLATGVWIGFDRPRTIVGNGYAGQIAAPLWGRFMASATGSDPASPFVVPDVMVSVDICRVSGERAHEACQRAEVSYVELFAPGTASADECMAHPRWDLTDLIARDGAATPGVELLPPPLLAVLDAADTTPVPIVPAFAPPPDEMPDVGPERKKRGFWSRLFGLGRGG
jgi:1A family penicillin-binding protein